MICKHEHQEQRMEKDSWGESGGVFCLDCEEYLSTLTINHSKDRWGIGEFGYSIPSLEERKVEALERIATILAKLVPSDIILGEKNVE